MSIIADITKNILSDYIEYDQLLELVNYIPNLKIDPKRIEIVEECDREFDQIPIKYTYIDGFLRKEERDAGYLEGDWGFEINYSKDCKKDGKQYGWYSNNIKESEENYKDGEKDGTQYKWYQNGKKEGKQYCWWDNGNMRSEENYKNGEMDGKQYYWTLKNDKQWYECLYENGKFVQ